MSASSPVDICIYGATPAGITAAIAAKQEGASVLLIEPSRWLGGILGAGIKPAQDCSEARAVGGLTKKRVFELGETPPLIRQNLARWLEAEEIPLLFEQRVARVCKNGASIRHIELELAPPDALGVPTPKATGAGETIEAKLFIDASYEGDLMALAGVQYATGREGREEFGEAPAGVGKPTNWTPIDPYICPGDIQSGLLPLLEADHGLPEGAGDRYTQAYNFRFYITQDPEKSAPLAKPDGYDAAQFEIIGRYAEHIAATAKNEGEMMERLSRIFPGTKCQDEYNYQRTSLFTIAPLGISRGYQDGDWPARAQVWQGHIDYLNGLHHFLSTDARVPAAFREQTARTGLERAMHPETGGWPQQLYVRIARRMKGRYVLTHADVLNQTCEADSIGLALYGVDTYPARHIATRDPQHGENGQMGVASEGNMFLGKQRGTGVPYPVPYRALTPKIEACSNLLVPVCFSASYIAYASARMEPVFSILGESAGVAAALAVQKSTTVQNVDVPALQRRLVERGQILEWPAPSV